MTTTEAVQPGYAAYDRITSRWGRITMITALVISLSVPLYLVFFSGLGVTGNELLIAFLAVAAVYGVIWVIEPITYYPILGPAAMYQAFMIGNLANKLIPAAIVAQQTIDAKPGGRRAELSAVTAICGAAFLHIVSLLLLVGLLGTWLISVLPASVIEVAQLYIFPAIIGAVVVQLAAYAKQPRITVIALGTAVVVQVLMVPVLGDTFANFATALVVFGTVALSWFLRDRRPEARGSDDGGDDQRSA
jgi:hypothetical protein